MRLFAAGWMVIGIAALCCGTARAGTYDVWACRLPNGGAAPINGWQATPFGSMQSTCASGGLLETQLDDAADVPYYVDEGWLFRAPADTTIDNLTTRRAVAVSGYREYHLYREFTGGMTWPPARTDAEKCVTWFDPCTRLGDLGSGGTFSASNLGGTIGLSLLLECNPATTPQVCARAAFPDNGVIRIWSARIGLADSIPPTITSGPSGSLIDNATRATGVQVVRFAAIDRGGGLQTMGLLVDGEPRAVQPIDPGNASCRPPYTALVPCPLSTQPTLAVDAREIANGQHSVRVFVTDVAGNQTQSDPVQVTVRNGGQPNGMNASGVAKLEAWFKSNRAHRTSATVAYGASPTIEGRLTTSDGKPIGAALLDATSQVTRPGSEPEALGTVVTDAQGRFAIPVPRGSSRELHLGYRAHTFDDQEAASATLTLDVRAGVRLAVTPRRVRNGTRARFSGRLLGGPGQFGTQVTIYALTARRPIPVETVAADQRGRFRYRYRFSAISGRGGFRFQAVVKSQPTYPYALGRSATVSVRARP
jgi:hypothetical protein